MIASIRPEDARVRRLLTRPLVAGIVLLLVYLGLSLANDPRGYLGTDTGAKVATLRAMERNGGFDPDVGYWAEQWDPEGRLHPLYQATPIGDRWVAVTTFPALDVAYPLWRLGGYRAALLVPMLGAVAVAFAARALARRLTDGSGWPAFWLVGLASPIAIYALDFWEHTVGVALLAWAVVVLLDVFDRRWTWSWAFVAGLLIGTAATMRTEALVYGAVATAVVGVAILVTRRTIVVAVLVGLAVATGLILPLLANQALERATVDGTIRTERASGAAVAAVTGETGQSRVEEAMLTGLSLHPRLDPEAYLVGALVAVLLVYGARRARTGIPDRGPAAVAAVGVAALYAIRLAAGPGFVPGLVAVTPLAAVGLAWGWSSARERFVLAIAVLALPVVWAFQYTGGAAPQWGGRYILPSGLLLGVAGAVALPRLVPWARLGLVALAVSVTAFGWSWLAVRSHDVARVSAALEARTEPILISRIAHLVREGGGVHDLDRWLTAVTDEGEREAVAVVRAAGFSEFAVVDLDETSRARVLPGFHRTGRQQVRFFSGIDLVVTTYQATS